MNGSTLHHPARWAAWGLALCVLMVPGLHCQPENDMDVDTQVLHIALQDGFDDEPVVVLVNGEEVLHKENIRTDPRIGVAYAFEVPLPDAPVMVEVQLPRQQVSDSVQVNADGTVHLGVSYLNGALHFKTSAVPFGYV